MKSTSTQIKQYTDYRTFLVAHAQEMKTKKKAWSFGIWARALGLKDPSSITKILQGQRDPGPEITERLIHYFHFNQSQARYFRDLIRLEKLRDDPTLSVLLMERMGKEHPDGRLRVLDDKTFSIISNWHYLPLREALRRKELQGSEETLAKKFLFKVTPKEIAHAIKTMLAAGLLIRDEAGILQLAEGRLDTMNDVASEAIKRFHEQMLSHAREAVRAVPVEEREVTSTTLLMKSENLPRAKALIREFKQKFEALLEEETGDRVFQFQIQLFPLTENLNERAEAQNGKAI